MSFQCDYCESTFTSKLGLNKHVAKACRAIFIEKQSTDTCPFCQTHFSTRGNCKRHIDSCSQNPDKGKELTIHSNHQNTIQQQNNIQQLVQNNNYGNYYDVKIIQNITVDTSELDKKNRLSIYSIPQVNDKDVYTDEYCQKMKDKIQFDIHRTMASYRNSFFLTEILMDYVEFVYFNPEFPQNFSIIYYKEEHGQTLIKENNRWGLFPQAVGLEKLFHNVRKNFGIFMNYFRSLDWIQEDIAKHQTPSSILPNLFLADLDQFLLDLRDIDLADCFSKKQKLENLTESSKHIFHTFVSEVKLHLIEHQKLMKEYYCIDTKNMKQQTGQIDKNEELFQIMKTKMEETMKSIKAM